MHRSRRLDILICTVVSLLCVMSSQTASEVEMYTNNNIHYMALGERIDYARCIDRSEPRTHSFNGNVQPNTSFLGKIIKPITEKWVYQKIDFSLPNNPNSSNSLNNLNVTIYTSVPVGYKVCPLDIESSQKSTYPTKYFQILPYNIQPSPIACIWRKDNTNYTCPCSTPCTENFIYSIVSASIYNEDTEKIDRLDIIMRQGWALQKISKWQSSSYMPETLYVPVIEKYKLGKFVIRSTNSEKTAGTVWMPVPHDNDLKVISYYDDLSNTVILLTFPVSTDYEYFEKRGIYNIPDEIVNKFVELKNRRNYLRLQVNKVFDKEYIREIGVYRKSRLIGYLLVFIPYPEEFKRVTSSDNSFPQTEENIVTVHHYVMPHYKEIFKPYCHQDTQTPVPLQPHPQPQAQLQPQAQPYSQAQPHSQTQLQPHPQPQAQPYSQAQLQSQPQLQPQLQYPSIDYGIYQMASQLAQMNTVSPMNSELGPQPSQIPPMNLTPMDTGIIFPHSMNNQTIPPAPEYTYQDMPNIPGYSNIPLSTSDYTMQNILSAPVYPPPSTSNPYGYIDNPNPIGYYPTEGSELPGNPPSDTLSNISCYTMQQVYYNPNKPHNSLSVPVPVPVAAMTWYSNPNQS